MTKPLPIKVTRRAAREIKKAAEWWEANRPAAPGAVREEIERVFRLIALQPGIGARATNTKLVGVRRVHLEGVTICTTASGRTPPSSRFSHCGTRAVERVRVYERTSTEPAVGADAWEAARLNGYTSDGVDGSRDPR